MIIEESTTSQIGVSFVALVDKPAIEKNFMAFNAMKIEFSKDEEKRIISGPAMVANSLIYRKDDNGEYNVFFSKKTIEEIALKFFKMDYQKNLNLFHDPNLSLDGVTIFESFVTDSSRGVLPMKGFEDLPDGTWFISCKIENDAVWEKIKTGEVKGFSVEGIFNYVKKPQAIEDQISELLNRTFNNDGLFKETDVMSSVKEMVAKFKKSFFDQPGQDVNASGTTSTEYTLKDGTAITVDKVEVGGVVLIAGIPAPAGDHELSDGTKITVGEGGLITAVTPVVVDTTSNDMSNQTKTPEGLIQAIKDTVAKFAAGTPEERLANLEVIAKALMDYSFGWEIRKSEEEAQRAAAIAVYKTGLVTAQEQVTQSVAASATAFESLKTEMNNKVSAVKTELEQKLTESQKTIEKQDKIITGLFELVEKLADLPTAEGVGENRTNFSADKLNRKEAKIKTLADSISKLHKSKTA